MTFNLNISKEYAINTVETGKMKWHIIKYMKYLDMYSISKDKMKSLEICTWCLIMTDAKKIKIKIK